MSNPDRSGPMNEWFEVTPLEAEAGRSGDQLLARIKRFKADLKVSHDALVKALGNPDATHKCRWIVCAAEMMRYDIGVHSPGLQSNCEEVLALGERLRRGEGEEGYRESSTSVSAASSR